VANHEGAKAGAKAEQHEAILVVGVVWIVDKQRRVVQENGLRLLERDAVFLPVRTVLPLVPFEPEVSYPYIIPTS
jgi:hypothetical protein